MIEDFKESVPVPTVVSSHADVIDQLHLLEQYAGPPAEFWPNLVKTLVELIKAEGGIIAIRAAAATAADWKMIAAQVNAHKKTEFLGRFANTGLQPIADSCAHQGSFLQTTKELELSGTTGIILGIRFDTGRPDEFCIAVFQRDDPDRKAGEHLLVRLRLAASIPLNYQKYRTVVRAQQDVTQFAAVLDLLALINAEKRYIAAAMCFCNEMASRFQCDRVSLGWLKGKYIRLQAMSHTEKFDRKMSVVKKLEFAMEEAFDQDQEIVHPGNADDPYVSRDHEIYAREQATSFVCSLPLRVEKEPQAVVTLERNSQAFSDDEMRYLRLYCDQSTRLLADLKHSDRWFGARWCAKLKEWLGKVFGVEHTWAKVIALICAGLLVFLIFGKWEYRVEAPFTVRSENAAYTPAPFDGFIKTVNFKVGDIVQANDLLLSLDTRELLLEQAAAIAEKNRFLREIEKARAEKDLSNMQIAAAQVKQTELRLELVNYRITQAEIRAPIAGVIAEGEYEEKIGSPVQKGAILFQISGLEQLYLDLDVKESDIHEVSDNLLGEAAFSSQPKLKFPIKVTHIEPIAQAKDQQNIFIIRCHFNVPPDSWWRPGMNGVAKINAGERPIWWILSHRTIDFLRLWLWY